MFNHLSGTTRLFPIIGDPIMYVESPARVTRTFADLGYNGICVPIQVTKEDFEDAMTGLSAMVNVDGILVTMPHKFAAMAHCATSSERSRLLGVVSVMRRNPDRGWHGDMLDGLAFVKAQMDHGARIEGARALLLGAGGAGRAIAHALLESGVRELVIHDADVSRAAVLVDLMSGLGDDRVKSGPPDPRGFDLIFNATPMGMEDGDALPLNVASLSSSMFVGDVIAGHGVTAFVRAAMDAGCKTAGGDDMVRAVQNLMAEFLIERGPQ
jgi:shikimate dehydrogenase